MAISIHAPLAGRDRLLPQPRPRQDHFNPRAPCGARRRPPDDRQTAATFQSTRPLRGATSICKLIRTELEFQSTRPLRGATSSANASSAPQSNFNPRAPCGARRRRSRPRSSPSAFQSTRPLRGATDVLVEFRDGSKFQSTRPLRGATANLTNSYPQICAKVTKGTC